MKTIANKKQENKKTVANLLPKLHSNNGQAARIVDNRPGAVAQRKLQKAINNSPRVQQLKAIQSLTNNVKINDDAGLEKEADAMGEKALQLKPGKNIQQDIPASNGMKSNLIQRAIRTGDKQYSFQGIFDENGNPFLKRRNTGKEEGYAKLSTNQPNLVIKNIEYDDTYLDTSNEETLGKIKNNIEKYRSVNVKSGDVKGVMVSSKSYLFKGGTRPDVALYDKGGDTPSKYTDFYKDAYKDLYELINCYKEDDLTIHAVNDLWSNFIGTFIEMANQKRLVIIAEEYRVPGASKINGGLDLACYDAVKLYKNRCIEMLNNKHIDQKELYGLAEDAYVAYQKCTKDLPWAGTGGKKNFLKDRIKDLNELGYTDDEINEELHLTRDDYYPYNIGSPLIHQDIMEE